MASSGGIFSSPDEVQKWYDAVQLYDAGELHSAVDKFKDVMPCTKMLFNIGCCYLSINEIDSALQSYEEAIQMDSHMAVSYFMVGLIYYLKHKLDTSLEYFEKARAALRGNMYIDYSQLGLNYKLYACEIKTNQACVLFKQNQVGKAKELLLLATTCKTEKRHIIISESFNMLQAGAGCAMSLFFLPRHLIFRPSQKIINQLKKKDYLGKAKVVAAENTEDMYACFSGLKAHKDGKIPSHVKEEDVKTMLRDIKISDQKEKLKRAPPQKNLPVLKLGKVIEKPPSHVHPSQTTHNATQNVYNNKKEDPPRRPPLPIQPAPTRSESVDANINKTGNRNPQAPPRPPPAKMSPILDRVVNSDARNRSPSVPRKEPNKILKKPPVAPKYLHHDASYNRDNRDSRDNNNNNSNDSNSSNCSNSFQDCSSNQTNSNSYGGDNNNSNYDSNNNNCNNNNSNNNNNNNNNNSDNNNNNSNNSNNNNNFNDSWQTVTPDKKVHEVEIFYTFSRKIRLKEGLSLCDLQNIVEAQAVPDDIHICTTDEHGRTQALTQRTLEKLLTNQDKIELYCSTNYKNQNGPT